MKMSKTRLFVSKKLSANILIYIKNKQHHFLKNVLRIKKEDSINLFDGFTGEWLSKVIAINRDCLLYTSPSPRDRQKSRMPSSA